MLTNRWVKRWLASLLVLTMAFGLLPSPLGGAAEAQAAGARSVKVLLIESTLPWDSDANTRLLNDLKSRKLIDSWEKCAVSQFKNRDVSQYSVIFFANDQTTETYNEYVYIIDELEFFAKMGGVVVFGACDQGWGGHGTLSAKLPGGVLKKGLYQRSNYIAQSHPILTGEYTDRQRITNDDLVGYYCSHSSFVESSLPRGSTVILRGSDDKLPTLVQYPLGNGHVIASGLTWEYYYARYRDDGTYAPKGFDDLIVYATRLSQVEIVKKIRVRVSANRADGSGAEGVNSAVVELFKYQNNKYQIIKTMTTVDGYVDIDLSAFSVADLLHLQVRAYKRWYSTVSSDDKRYPLFEQFPKSPSGEVYRYIYELHSSSVDSGGIWRGFLVKENLATGKDIELVLREPRIRFNLSVSYYEPTTLTQKEKAAYFDAVVKQAGFLSRQLAAATDWHAVLNDIRIIKTNSREHFYFNNDDDYAMLSSMCDLRIEASEHHDAVSGKTVQVWSNAHVDGYYHDDFSGAYLDGFNMLPKGEKDKLKSRSSFYRIQMSALEGAGWDHSIYKTIDWAKTVTHESGHYSLGLFDEYMNGDEKKWRDIKRVRNMPANFGLMEHQQDSIELSKSFDYNYLEGRRDINKETRQYYIHSASCEDYYAKRLAGDLRPSSCPYMPAYTTTTKEDRTVIYHDARPNSIEKISNSRIKAKSDVSFAPLIGLAMIAGGRPGIQPAYAGNGVVLTIPPVSGYSHYRLYENQAGTLKEIALSGNQATLTMEPGEVKILQLNAADASGKTVSHEITVDYEKLTKDGYAYLSPDERTVGYAIPVKEAGFAFISYDAPYINGEYSAMGPATMIAGEGTAFRGGLYAAVKPFEEINHGSLQWFVSRDDGDNWKALASDAARDEYGNIGVSCQTDGEGLYALMAKPAAKRALSGISLDDVRQHDSEEDMVAVTITDKSDAVRYAVYYHDTGFTQEDIDAGRIAFRQFDAKKDGTTSTYLFKADRGEKTKQSRTIYVGVVAMRSDGSRTELIKHGGATIAPFDANKDGIPDWYADMYMLWDLVDRSKDISGLDPDGDGLSNLEEYRRGGDPADPFNGKGGMQGDVNGDGQINYTDAGLVLLYAVGKTELKSKERLRADMNGDGRVNSTDASLLLLHNTAIAGSQPGKDVQITVSDCVFTVGNTCEVTLYINGGSNAYNADFLLNYDTSKLTYVTARRGGLFELEQVNEHGAGKLRMSFAGNRPVTTGGTLITLVFDCVDGVSAELIEHTMAVSNFNTFDAAKQAIPINNTVTQGIWSIDVPISEHTITARAGEGGSITPAGRISVLTGADQSFIIKAADGYVIDRVIIDGTSQTGVVSYTFQDVRKDHSIEATFKKPVAPAETGDSFPWDMGWLLLLILGGSLLSIVYYERHKKRKTR